MALLTTSISWARPRVQNFTEDYAQRLIHELVALDGREFDKVAFFRHLVDHGVLNDPTIPEGRSQEEIYSKRWDSYLAPIRPFGLGFNVEERRTNSPNQPLLIWRASPMALAFDRGEITHTEFMAVQLARTQFPKITMPLKEPAKSELRAGARVLPFALFADTVRELAVRGQPAMLSLSEVYQLARCETNDDVGDVVDQIVQRRTGQLISDWSLDPPSDLDILVNDLDATGFWRRLATTGGDRPMIVPRHARFLAAGELANQCSWIDVTTDRGVEEYFERLASAPDSKQLRVLRREPQIASFGHGEVMYDATTGTLTGPSHLVGGLASRDQAYLHEAGRLVAVDNPALGSEESEAGWLCTAKVSVIAHRT